MSRGVAGVAALALTLHALPVAAQTEKPAPEGEPKPAEAEAKPEPEPKPAEGESAPPPAKPPEPPPPKPDAPPADAPKPPPANAPKPPPSSEPRPDEPKDLAPGETEATTATPGRASGIQSRPSNTTPFGKGAKVQITATKLVDVYVAKGSEDFETIELYEFVKVGKTPITFELPPGLYTVEIEAPGVTRGSKTLEMNQDSRQLMGDTGSAELGVVGSISLALGVTAILTGVVTLAAFSDKPDLKSRETKIAIPLFAGGAVLTGAGIGMFIASRTTLEETTPGRQAKTRLPDPKPSGILAGGSLSF